MQELVRLMVRLSVESEQAVAKVRIAYAILESKLGLNDADLSKAKALYVEAIEEELKALRPKSQE